MGNLFGMRRRTYVQSFKIYDMRYACSNLLFLKATPSFFLGGGGLFKLLLRWNCRYWSLECVYGVSCRWVKIRRSMNLSVFHKIKNGGIFTDCQLWVLEAHLFLVSNEVC